MKQTTIILFFPLYIAIAYGSVSTFECPELFGTFLNPNNCYSYYICHEGVAYHRNCPPPLYFDLSVEACRFHPDGIC